MSCEYVNPSILVNDTGADVEVRYEMYRYEIAPGKLAQCRFDSDPVRVAPTVVSGSSWRKATWEPLENARYDRDTCAVEQVVKAGTSVWIETNGLCNDYRKYLERNPALRPTVPSLTVVSSAHKIELKGWEVASAFEQRSGGACILSLERLIASHHAGR